MERKLAAILATDIVGFAGLVSRDESGTLAKLVRLEREIIGMQVEANRGRVFKSTGDGFLAEFSSVFEAVNCAINIQRACAREARRSNSDDPLILRVGVSLGDVVVHGDDILGDGVNTAARLEAIAEPGEIAVSGEVMAQIAGKIDLPLADCGHKRLKRTDSPIHVYMTVSEPGEEGGFLDFDEDELAKTLITGGCICGLVRYEINAPAISTGYCHCSCCRKFSGSAVNAWAAFPASAVRFLTEEPRYFATTPIANRGFCARCGASLTYKLVKPRETAYLVLHTSSLDQPENFAPSVHSGIESKMPWFDILDDLPRTRSSDSRVLQEAWSSVGLPDPETWGPLAKPPEVF
ncbi:GFA family protein [Ruegeria lacuscaerulensis]|uniref:GFA family protein n=1 Tax=Ruegeria lacuscaerulensis TaxID=55218 RepID=UPI00147E58D7|nr:GFA family protein [Ruegeria lacuscaerulensis]